MGIIGDTLGSVTVLILPVMDLVIGTCAVMAAFSSSSDPPEMAVTSNIFSVIIQPMGAANLVNN